MRRTQVPPSGVRASRIHRRVRLRGIFLPTPDFLFYSVKKCTLPGVEGAVMAISWIGPSNLDPAHPART